MRDRCDVDSKREEKTHSGIRSSESGAPRPIRGEGSACMYVCSYGLVPRYLHYESTIQRFSEAREATPIRICVTDFGPLIWVQTPHQAENENGWARLRLIVRLRATYVCETGPGSGLCEVWASLAAGGSGRAGLEVGAQVPLRQARARPKKIAPRRGTQFA